MLPVPFFSSSYQEMLNSILAQPLKKVCIDYYCNAIHFKQIARAEIKEILRLHYATIEIATQCSLDKIASQLYTDEIITESVKNTPSYSSIVKEFESILTLTNDISKLKKQCEVFLKCINQGGPTKNVVITLQTKWNEVFGEEELLPSVAHNTIPSSGKNSNNML